ncbi:adam a disintegrin and metalloprotease domain [Holotrichia oblita]|uniref:Adam a disintegrin and metalloprotease domain n=1 Tax=Holotrichia oblita TaxID=644536 RepID=A0ACB9TLC5_HOLOL|nr:adam a disintegrin and metalloprotease domain [Holotrichia oblita]
MNELMNDHTILQSRRKSSARFAYVGGACVINKRLEKVNSVAIIEDTGGFSGIIVAAHEVGHLLGAVHDGSPPPSYLGGPGAQKCQWEDGYIMSDLRHTERGFRWSPCSIASFHHFLNGDTASCLYNPPHEDDSLPRVLPGKLLTLDAQCRRDRGTSACFYCLNGRCVAEHENIIPDYSQNTPAYVRQDGSTSSGRSLSYNEDGNYNDNNGQNTPLQQNLSLSYNPFQFENLSPSTYGPPPPSSTYTSFPKFSISTTKSPYDFQRFNQKSFSSTPYNNLYTTSTAKAIVTITSSTINPYIGNYYQLRQRTTKSPYDFADFGKNFKNTNSDNDDSLNRNYLKRSYVSDSFFQETNNSKNITEHQG